MIFRLSGGHARDAPEGRGLLENWDTLVLPPKANRKAELDCGRDLYELRNEVERPFRRLKGYRRIFTRFNKLDTMFPGCLNLALVVEMIYDLAEAEPMA